MRNASIALLALFLIIIIIPALLVRGCDLRFLPKEGQDTQRSIRVYNHKTDEIMDLNFEEYIIGVVAAEMPASFDIEALKAQSIASRTYTINKMRVGCNAHPQGEICTDHTHCQAWLSQDEMRDRWGYLGYLRYKDRITEAVLATEGIVITYQGKPIDAIYHSTSGGKTENSEDVWANTIPYLRSVISPHEEHSPRFTESKTFPIIDFLASLKSLNRELQVSTDPLDKQMEILEYTEGGKIARIRIGNQVFTGKEIRETLGLNSAGFTYRITSNSIQINTVGYGHGVGMSQYGADGYARQGWDYTRILSHYYTETELRSMD